MKCDLCKTELQPWEMPRADEIRANVHARKTGVGAWLICCDACLRASNHPAPPRTASSREGAA